MNRPHTPRFLAVVAEAKTRVHEITTDDLKALLARGEKPVIVDVREDSEYAAGHGAGAIHLGKGVIERDIETEIPDAATLLVLYCGGGYRSALATDAIQKMGYHNVLSLDGGWTAWQEAGLPVES